MAVYYENADGSLTLCKPDKSLTDVIEEKKEVLLAEGIEPSPCLKDLLAEPSVSSKKK